MLKDINKYLKSHTGYELYPAQLAVAESVKRRLEKAKVAMIIAECGSGKTKIGSAALAAYQNRKKRRSAQNVFPSGKSRTGTMENFSTTGTRYPAKQQRTAISAA